MTERAAIVKAVRRTSESGECDASFDDWITEFGPSVLHFAFSRLRDRDEAEDVFQEVFVRAYRARDSLRESSKVKAWLLSVTANVCRDRMRWWQRQWRHTIADEVPDLVDPAADTPQIAVTRVRDEALWRKILSLPPPYRNVIILHYFEDMSTRSIAEVLGCNEQTVKTRLHRARKRLKDLLAEEDGILDR